MSFVNGVRPSPEVSIGGLTIPWRRIGKAFAGIVLLAAGAFTVHQQLLVRTSRDAVINARRSVVRAPIDGVVVRSSTSPGTPVQSGVTLGHVEDTRADDARAFQLATDLAAIERERDMLSGRLADLRRARDDAMIQAEAFRQGRIRQIELRIEESRAQLAGAAAAEAGTTSVEERGAILNARGFKSDAAQEDARHAMEMARQNAIAIRKRIEVLTVELEAAHQGTYLGDNYNDVPSSYQRARDLALRIDEAEQALTQAARRADAVRAQIGTERQRLAERTRVELVAAVTGPLWEVQAASGEYVRKGQDLFTVLDCSTAVVTATVAERDYNALHLGDPVRFRVAGTGREYHGAIASLGATVAGGLAIQSAAEVRQVTVALPELADSPEDRCAVGRAGQVIFDAAPGFAARLRGWLGFV